MARLLGRIADNITYFAPFVKFLFVLDMSFTEFNDSCLVFLFVLEKGIL